MSEVAGSDLRPAYVGSVVLHLLVLGAGLIVFPNRPSVISNAVPVTIVSSAPTPSLRPAIQAPEPELAAAPEVDVSPEPPVPELEPAPLPAPPPKAAPPPPATKAPPAPTKAEKPPTLDLDQLASRLPQPKQQRRPPQPETLDLDSLAARLPQRSAAQNRGAARPERATEARPALGDAEGLSADESNLLVAKLIRLWRPNCVAESGVQVRVNIRIGASGRLSAPPRLIGAQSNDAVWQAAAQRALSAVRQGEPYSELSSLPLDANINFNAREACGGL